MRISILGILLLLNFSLLGADWSVETPSPLIDQLEHQFKINSSSEVPNEITVNGRQLEPYVVEGDYYFNYIVDGDKQLEVIIDDEKLQYPLKPIPLWLSIFPPLIAIILALVFREVLISLFIGIAFGAILISVYDIGGLGILTGFVHIIDIYILDALNDSGHLSIIVFSLLIGAVVALISKNGGMKGVVNVLARYAKSPRSGQLATFFLGLAIFFDDYANTLVVGNTMRPVTDKLGISRAKLSYIVDSTAAPVAAIAFITTWIGAELSYLSSGIEQIPAMQGKESAYGIFLGSLQYAYYPILTLFFIFLIVYLKRDFGPMWSAEMKARAENNALTESPVEELESKTDNTQSHWINAILPITVLIVVAIVGLIVTGQQGTEFKGDESMFQKLALVIGNADSYKALLWASLSGLLAALLMTVSQKLLSIESSMKAIVNGFESILPAILILVLAWSLAILTEQLHTADFLSSLMRGNVSPIFFPVITFILSALVSFATGSSWGTMAILYPLMLGTSWALGEEFGLEYAENLAIFKNVAACILAGSVLGDHCSPISDTTILSSLATQTDHLTHVRTQMPYALTVGTVAIVLGILPAAAGVAWWILFPVAIVLLYLIVRYLGKPTDSIDGH